MENREPSPPFISPVGLLAEGAVFVTGGDAEVLRRMGAWDVTCGVAADGGV